MENTISRRCKISTIHFPASGLIHILYIREIITKFSLVAISYYIASAQGYGGSSFFIVTTLLLELSQSITLMIITHKNILKIVSFIIGTCKKKKIFKSFLVDRQVLIDITRALQRAEIETTIWPIYTYEGFWAQVKNIHKSMIYTFVRRERWPARGKLNSEKKK